MRENKCNNDFCEINEQEPNYFEQNGEEITPDMLAELSNGKGDDENE
jgi:hypothetical protein